MRDAVLVVLAIVTAGCSADSAPQDELEQEFEDLDLDSTKTTGIVRGLVVDATLTPVPDAKVVLSPGNLETTTSEQGLFGFKDLAPGSYFIKVMKARYADTQQSTEVVAGVDDPAVVKVLLERIPGSDPYVAESHYSAYISCSFLTANYVWDASWCDPTGHNGMAANDDSQPIFEVLGVPTYYQSEMSWESSQALGSDLVTIQYACGFPDCGDSTRTCNVWGTTPLVCRVNGTVGGGGGGVGLEEARLGDGRGLSVNMYAGCVNGCVIGAAGAGLVIEQDIDIYNFMFYGYEPPSDWVFVETNEIPEPPK